MKNIALVKEIESPENPQGLEKRVALIPLDVAKIISFGVIVFVEFSAGKNMGFSDEEYVGVGAIMQSSDEIYHDKDMIIKFKGPSMDSILQMRQGCVLFCMAHFHSFPKRAQLLQDNKINVVAMEEILESPKNQSDEAILSRLAMGEALKRFIDDGSISELRVFILGYSTRLSDAMRRAGNRNPLSLNMLSSDLNFSELDCLGSDVLYFYDSKEFKNLDKLIAKLKDNNCHTFDLANFEKSANSSIKEYKDTHPAFKFGLRRIQCLHETGQAGARYGIKLLKENKPSLDIKKAKVLVLGYGNVGRGAIREAYDNGIENIHILGRNQTSKNEIEKYLKNADLIINGAEQSEELRGINFLISNKHLKNNIDNNSVVIDLVGGSSTNRSPVEAVIHCTFLTNPHFIKENVTISAIWGWPMMEMAKESNIKYSSQIVDVLLGKEKLIKGLDDMSDGVKRALLCGVF